jgi:hypothetical protein
MKHLITLLLWALPVSLIAEEKKPFGTGMNGEKPLVPYQGTVEYWSQAVALYPEAADANSAMFKEMVKINKWLEQVKDPVCSVPDRKLRVAHMAAAKLGMPLKGAVPTTPDGTPAAANQAMVNPAELMVLIQQEEATAGGTRSSTKDSRAGALYTEGRWRGKNKKELVAWCCEQFAAKYGYTPLYEEGAPVGGWKTEEGRGAAADKKARDSEEALRRADEIRRELDQKRALDEINRNVKKKNGGI